MTPPDLTHASGDPPAPSPAPLGGVEFAPGRVVPDAALRFTASRSSGPGGQNVNKVSSRIELRVRLADIPLSAAALGRLRALAGRRINDEGELVLIAEDSRSQHQNRALAVERLRELLVRALVVPKLRVKTKPTKSSQRRRVDDKKARGRTKAQRRDRGHDS
ncbi:MAG: alternative ribosome rescue aminoacyl-tRNA hydrolase ArfB [Planctomycetota bacterium]|nr:alternative ribosome rescue aminoacyl-tRNA hydrolase ArfB [Planctomycetota bacterium]